MLQDEIYSIYNQIINAIFITRNLEVGDVYEFDQETNQAYGYEAARSKTFSYNFIAEDGQEYTKSITFRYEPIGEGFPEIKPLLISISEGSIDNMQRPVYNFSFKDNSIEYLQIW